MLEEGGVGRNLHRRLDVGGNNCQPVYTFRFTP